MDKMILNGEWRVSGGRFSNVQASVPGCIHTDLLNNDLIVDPYYRDNESELMYIGETDWTYEREFDVADGFIGLEHVRLICHGLDTFAEIYVNNHFIDKTDNMFRKWEYDIKDSLVPGTNHIKIVFKSTYPYMEEKLKERYLHITGMNHHRILGNNYVRKMQCNYGWDWGPMCVTAGIWKDIELVGYDKTRIDNIQIKQEHKLASVELEVITHLTDDMNKGSIKVDIAYAGNSVHSEVKKVKCKSTLTQITVSNPKKWWPNNLGEQHLYHVTVSLMDDKGNLLDHKIERIGLRTLELDIHEDEFGETFQFVVNGIPFFAKGANWIPIDTFITRGTDEFYRELLVDARDANMNFIRVWGGGVYESDVFYNICDELGLCVWQDFAFACSAYPVYDEAFIITVKEEVKDNVIRLRNHPSLALWCGNNEIEYMGNMISDDGRDGTMTWDEYKLLFDDIIPTLVNEYDGEHNYWASSPMDGAIGDGTNGQDPTRGDAHLWDVWHGLKPFEWYRSCDHRFNSEFGFQSFPEPEVVKGYTAIEDRNITSYVMEKHQRSDIGNSVILHYMLSWFRLPTSFDMMLWTSQILQSLAIKYAVENWRRKMPQGMGTLYWQLNDCWPVASWSSIDFAGNMKALHYGAKKFFNPLLISGVEDKENLVVELYLSNDTLKDVKGNVHWKLFNLDGTVLLDGTLGTKIEANHSEKIATLCFEDKINEVGSARNVVLYYSFEVNGEIVSDNTTFFEYPKHLKIEKPTIDTLVSKRDNKTFEVKIKTNKPTFWIWIELNGVKSKYSDRFFDLFNGYEKNVIIATEKEMTIDEFETALKIYSIVDTYK